MTKLYYRKSDMKLVVPREGEWPEKPDLWCHEGQCLGAADNLGECECADKTKAYEAALQKAIEEAIPLTDQNHAAIRIEVASPIIDFKLVPGNFYDIKEEVEIGDECQYKDVDGNCTDCFRGSLCKKVARIKPSVEQNSAHGFTDYILPSKVVQPYTVKENQETTHRLWNEVYSIINGNESWANVRNRLDNEFTITRNKHINK